MFTLRATDLFSKWGFKDGELLDDFLWESGFGDVEAPEDWPITFQGKVLALTVERWLLPALPRAVETLRGAGLHNPIRARSSVGGDDRGLDLEGICVVVCAEQVLEIANAVQAEIEG